MLLEVTARSVCVKIGGSEVAVMTLDAATHEAAVEHVTRLPCREKRCIGTNATRWRRRLALYL